MPRIEQSRRHRASALRREKAAAAADKDLAKRTKAAAAAEKAVAQREAAVTEREATLQQREVGPCATWQRLSTSVMYFFAAAHERVHDCHSML